jgi:hypothetical protein
VDFDRGVCLLLRIPPTAERQCSIGTATPITEIAMTAASLPILPLSQLVDLLPPRWICQAAIGAPLAGFLIGLLVRLRFSRSGGIICAIYYTILIVDAVTEDGTRPSYVNAIVGIGLLIGGPIIGLITLLLGLSGRRKQVQPRGFPVVQKDASNPVTPVTAPSTPPRP